MPESCCFGFHRWARLLIPLLVVMVGCTTTTGKLPPEPSSPPPSSPEPGNQTPGTPGDEALGNGHDGGPHGEADSVVRALEPTPQQRRASPAAVHFNRAVMLARRGSVDKAIPAFKRAIAIDPEFAEAHYALGLAFLKKGLHDHALEEFRDAIDLNPQLVEARARLAHLLQRKGLLDRAATQYKRVLARSPDHTEARVNLAAIYLESGANDAAIALYRQGLRRQPSAAALHYNLGIALSRNDDLAGAESSYRRALALAPGMLDAQINLAIVLHRMDQLEDADQVLLSALDQTSRPEIQAELQYHRASILEANGLVGDAIDALEESLQLNSRSAEAHHYLGWLYHKSEDLTNAYEAYVEAMRLEADDATYHADFAQLLRAMGRHEEAIAAYLESLRIDPSLLAAYDGLFECYVQLNDTERARLAALKATRIRVKHATSSIAAARMLNASGDSSGALNEAETALEFDPSNEEASFELARAYLGLGEVYRAEEIAQTLSTTRPELAQELQALIRRANKE